MRIQYTKLDQTNQKETPQAVKLEGQ